MKKLFATLSAIALLSTLTACNTISGAGKDIQKGGEHVQEAAHSVQKDMKKN